MREILFKAKRLDNGEWVYGGIVYKENRAFIVKIVKHIPDTRDWELAEYYEKNPQLRAEIVEVDPETVCQYTGLNDKNGKKIFERDIMIFSAYGLHYRGSVQFVDGNFSIICGQKAAPFLDDAIKRHQAVAVGNIFDNPELLEVGE